MLVTKAQELDSILSGTMMKGAVRCNGKGESYTGFAALFSNYADNIFPIRFPHCTYCIHLLCAFTLPKIEYAGFPSLPKRVILAST